MGRIALGLRRSIVMKRRTPQFSALLATSLEGIQNDAEERVSKHIAHHHMQDDGQAWIATGMECQDDKTCPFCGQNVEGLPLIHAYQALLSYHRIWCLNI